jgi:hypothetical protein
MSFQNPLPPGVRQVVPDYVSDGVTLAWGFPFRLWAAADLAVYVSANDGETWSQLANGTDFTVTIVGVTAAIATLAVAQAAGNLIRLMGLRTPARTTSVVNDGIVQSVPLEGELDCVEATLQEVRRDVNLLALAVGSPFGGSALAFGETFLAWWASLPTSLPAAAGQPWNDGGTLAVS